MEKKTGKKKLWMILVSSALVLALAVALFVKYSPLGKLRAYRILEKYFDQSAFSGTLDTDITVDGSSSEFSIRLWKVQTGGKDVFVTQYGNFSLYFTDDAVILENGISYPRDSIGADYWEASEDSVELFKNLKLTTETIGDTTVYTLHTAEEAAQTLLNNLLPESDSFAKVTSLSMTISAKGDELFSVTADGAGTLSTGSECSITAVFTADGSSPDENDLPIAVRQAVASGEITGNEEVAAHFDVLLAGYLDLFTRPTMVAELQVQAQAGLLNINTGSTLSRQTVNGQSVTALTTLGTTVFFSGDKACDENGNLLSDEILEDTTSGEVFLQKLYEVCIGSDAAVTESGGAYTFVFTPQTEDLSDLATALVPASRYLAMELTGGQVTVTVEGGTIAEISLSIQGEINLLLLSSPVSITAYLAPDQSDTLSLPSVSDSVLSALQ